MLFKIYLPGRFQLRHPGDENSGSSCPFFILIQVHESQHTNAVPSNVNLKIRLKRLFTSQPWHLSGNLKAVMDQSPLSEISRPSWTNHHCRKSQGRHGPITIVGNLKAVMDWTNHHCRKSQGRHGPITIVRNLKAVMDQSPLSEISRPSWIGPITIVGNLPSWTNHHCRKSQGRHGLDQSPLSEISRPSWTNHHCRKSQGRHGPITIPYTAWKSIKQK
jgi:hypothetical protein